MRKCIFLVVAMTICSTVQAAPFQVHMQGSLPYTVTPQSNAPSWMTQYRTFCVEEDVNFTPNGTYWATIDNVVKTGGSAGTPLGGTDATSATDAIKIKKIYAAYINNDLGAYSTSYSLIQNTIWGLRGYSKTIDAGLVTHATNASTDVSGYQLVKVLNLWGTRNGSFDSMDDAQSQLVMVPVPGAYLLGALGLGVANWRLRRRRLA